MTSRIELRPFEARDREAVDALVRSAWAELASVIPDWPELESKLGALTAKADESEVIVAERQGRLVGAVGYVGAQQPKPAFFDAGWPIVRLMSVAPDARGMGVGKRLIDACVERARRDGARTLALHTTPLMQAAQHLYQRAGFVLHKNLPPIFGAPYVLLTRDVRAT